MMHILLMIQTKVLIKGLSYSKQEVRFFLCFQLFIIHSYFDRWRHSIVPGFSGKGHIFSLRRLPAIRLLLPRVCVFMPVSQWYARALSNPPRKASIPLHRSRMFIHIYHLERYELSPRLPFRWASLPMLLSQMWFCSAESLPASSAHDFPLGRQAL